jgi:hypothetical protein
VRADPRTIEIKGAPLKLLALTVGSVLAVALCASVAFGYLEGRKANSFIQLVGWFGVAFFSLCAVIGLFRLLRSNQIFVTIAPQGIRDIRIAPEFIPWPAIRGISTWEQHRQKVMVLAVDPAVERRLTLTRVARWTRSANAKLGADGLCVAATGLKTDYDTLLATSIAYARAHGGHA